MTKKSYQNLLILLLSVMLVGTLLYRCAFASASTPADPAHITIGSSLKVDDVDSALQLQNNIDTLATDGLYYASWVIGEAKPFEKKDGETVDFYDAQLYLLLGEFPTSDDSKTHADSWYSIGKKNYEIQTEENITCHGQDYLMITYRLTGEDSPFAHGISVFAAPQNCAVCIELTCREDFDGDLRTILMDFLNCCTYIAE